jgi:hypothetical protein
MFVITENIMKHPVFAWEEEGGEKKSALFILGLINPFTSTFSSSDMPSKPNFRNQLLF